MAQVFLHVGLPKTGTTTIQAALHEAAPELARAGVLVPGGTHHAQRMAAFDLLGQRARGAPVGPAAGAFQRLVAEIDAWDGERVIVSEEELGLARPRQVRRVVRALAAHEVFVLIGVRDLGRTLVSAWQQGILMGDTTRWPDFVDAVRDPAGGDIRTGTSFRLRHDLLRVLDAWGSEVPPERIRIVTAPPPGSSTEVLLGRFAAAAGLPVSFATGRAAPLNRSPGPPQIEVVRRFNAASEGRLRPRQHRFVLERGIKPGLDRGTTRQALLPHEDLDWTQERSRLLIEEVRRRGHPAYGDLQDLMPLESATTDRRPDDVSTDELLAATEATLTSLAAALAASRRRAPGRAPADGRRSPAALAGSARAATFRLEKAVLLRARHHPLLARAVRAYLRRTSGA